MLKGTRIAYLLGCTFSDLNVDLHASRQFDLFVLLKHHAARLGSVDAFAACPHDGVKLVCCGGHVVLTCHYLPSFLVSHEVDGCIFPWYRPENHEPLPIITLKLCSDNSNNWSVQSWMLIVSRNSKILKYFFCAWLSGCGCPSDTNSRMAQIA